jgi:hypothetical protein
LLCTILVAWTTFRLKRPGHAIPVTIKLYFPTVILKMHYTASNSRRPYSRPHISRKRTGTATVELAVALPLLLSLVFASIELANGFFFEEAVVTAAYEGAREVARYGGTEKRAKEAIESFMASRGIKEYKVSFSWHRSQLERGDYIWCTVSAKRSSWSPISFGYLGDFETKRGVLFMCQ